MDILETNFPRLLPPTSSPSRVVTDKLDLNLSRPYKLSEFQTIRIFWNRGVAQAEAKPDRPAQVSGGLFRQKIQDNIAEIWRARTVRYCDELDELQSALEVLECEVFELRRLYMNPDLFPEGEDQAAYFRDAFEKLHEMKLDNDPWVEFEKALASAEENDETEKQCVRGFAGVGQEAYPWIRMCSNSRPFPSKIAMQGALAEGRVLLTCEQYMPRGGFFIVERWQQEVETVVDGIMQAVEDQARRKVIRLQRAQNSNTYFFTRMVKGIPKDAIGIVQRPHSETLNIGSFLADDNAVNYAGMVSVMRHRRAFIDPNHYVGLMWRKFLTVRGMRAEDRVIWSAKQL